MVTFKHFSQVLRRWKKVRLSWINQRYVVVDIETTGLNPKTDEILSIAWVVVVPPMIDIGRRNQFTLKPVSSEKLGQSPTIHGLTQRDFAHYSSIDAALEKLKIDLRESCFVCHNAQVDWQFLLHASKSTLQKLEPISVFDTLRYEHAVQNKNGPVREETGMYTLSSCRARYGLPSYPAHDAMDDAIACAELFLAQCLQTNEYSHSLRKLLKSY